MTTATPTPPKPLPGTPAMPVPLPRIFLEAGEVHADDHNHRIDDASDEALLDSLAASIAQNGQQQTGLVCLCPPGMAKKGEKYRLVFGFRRHQACLRANVAFHAEFIDRVLSDSEILSLRATENLDRDNLNPVEECLAVSKLADAMDAGGPIEPAKLQEEIANRLGRPVEWVRDRLYVHRLPKRVKDLVAAQVLPLTYARELAKVADPGRCEDLAEAVLSHREDRGPRRLYRSLSWLQNQVREERWSLKVVPWDVRVAFAGKPACVDCPHNTANDMALFEHDAKNTLPELQTVKVVGGDEVNVGLCLNKACHTKKDAEAMKALKAGVAKARAAVKKGTSSSAAGLTEAGLVPKGVKASTFSRWVGTAKEETTPAKGTHGSGVGMSEVNSAEEAIRKHKEAVRKWADANFATAAKTINANPHACVFMVLKGELHRSVKRREFNPTPADYRDATKATRAVLDDLVTQLIKASPEFDQDYTTWDLHNADATITLLQHLGLEVPPKPVLEATKPAKKATKKKAKK